MHAVIITRRKVDCGKIAVFFKLVRQGCITTQQLTGREIVAFRLDQAAIFNWTKLTDTAIGRVGNNSGSLGNGASSLFKFPHKEVVKVLK